MVIEIGSRFMGEVVVPSLHRGEGRSKIPPKAGGEGEIGF
jgi:hypothetical protein